MASLDGALLDRGSTPACTLETAFLDQVAELMTAPDFLCVIEQPGKLTDFALASRLSYFLWNSTPDEELLDVARQGRLHDPKVLREQTERLLNGPEVAAVRQRLRRSVARPAGDRRHHARQGSLSRIRRVAEDLQRDGNAGQFPPHPGQEPERPRLRRAAMGAGQRTPGRSITALPAVAGFALQEVALPADLAIRRHLDAIGHA